MKQYLLFLPFLALTSCLYTPDTILLKKVNRPNPSSYYLNLNNQSGNPIQVYKKTTFQFSISPSNLDEYNVEVFVGGALLNSFQSSQSTVYFTLDPVKFDNGIHELSVTVTMPSGSGSLADKLGAEVFTVNKKWSIKIDWTAPASVDQPTIAIENGKLMVRWNKPVKDNFLQYIILRKYYTGNLVTQTDSLKPADVLTDNHHDKYYVGGKVSYRVDLKGYPFYVQGTETFFDCVPIAFSFQPDNQAPKIKFERSILYGNDLKLSFFSPFEEFNPSSAGERIVTDPSKLGDLRTINIELRENTANGQNRQRYKMKMNVHRGFKLRPFDAAIYSPQQSAYFLFKKGTTSKLYKVNPTTMTITDSLTMGYYRMLIASQNGEHAYVASGSNSQMTKVDLSSMTLTNSFDLNTTSLDHKKLTQITLSNDNVMAFPDGGVKDLKISDYYASWIVQASSSSISPDGTHIFASGKMYKRDIATNVLTYIGYTNSWSPGGIFTTGTPSYFLMKYTSGLYTASYMYDVAQPPDALNRLVSLGDPPFSLSGNYDPHTDTYFINEFAPHPNLYLALKKMDGSTDSFRPWLYKYWEVEGMLVLFVNNVAFHRYGYCMIK